MFRFNLCLYRFLADYQCLRKRICYKHRWSVLINFIGIRLIGRSQFHRVHLLKDRFKICAHYKWDSKLILSIFEVNGGTLFRHFSSNRLVVLAVNLMLVSARFLHKTLQAIHAKMLFTLMFGITRLKQSA